MIRIGIDTGGTFTDFVVVQDGRISTWKEPSTPEDPSRAILHGLERILAGARAGVEVVHGSTVATNALLEGRTAAVAFVTNSGFEDLIEIGRQARPDLYDLAVERPAALAPRERRFGIAGRLRHDGAEIDPIDEAAVADLAGTLSRAGTEAVAICLLHSYADPRHEEAVARVLADSGFSVSVSSRLVREYREYERASTTAVNAAVSPVVSRYLSNLSEGLGRLGLHALRVMGSNGGALSPRAAGEEAVRTVLSGPAAGVRAALHAGSLIDRTQLISFDMGGTSTDVSLIPGEARLTGEAVVAGHPVKVPTIDIHTVGAGGGSVAWRDPGGALRVGPASAGADPGPACYGKGGPATVTDANVVLGRIVPDRFLDGRMPLDVEASRRAVADLARSLRLDPLDAAEGIVTVAEATMARAIRVISLYRGYEPADFSLIAFGGAGGLHAASLASALDMTRTIVPWEPGVFSAFGMTVADVVRDRSASILADASGMTPGALDAAFAPLEARCLEDLEADGVPRERIEVSRSLDMRYRGQSHELPVPMGSDPADDGWRGRFHDEHQRRFGYARPDEPVELVTLRVRGTGRVDPPRPHRADPGSGCVASSLRGSREIRWGGRAMRAALHERSLLPPSGDGSGEERLVFGPAIIVEPGSTVLVPPAWAAGADVFGNLHLRRSVG